MKPKFAIGQQFKTRGKAPRLCTVTDILSLQRGRRTCEDPLRGGARVDGAARHRP
jgi:hypothetical protein